MRVLLQDRILAACAQRGAEFDTINRAGLKALHPIFSQIAQARGRTPTYWYDHYRQDMADLAVTMSLATGAQTILFDDRQALALRRAMLRFTDRPFWRLPWAKTIIQFDNAIPENEFFQHEDRHYIKGDDPILGLVLGEHDQYREVVVWYSSDEVQRVRWTIDNLDFRVDINPLVGISKEAVHNKRQAQLLAMACLMYLSAENIEIAREEPLPTSKGSPYRPAVYRAREVVAVTKLHYTPEPRSAPAEDPPPARTGSKHSYRYDVDPHFRTTASGKIVVIKGHERGTSNPPETKRKAVKRVRYTPDDPRLTE